MAGNLNGLLPGKVRLCEIGPDQTVAVLSERERVRDHAEASLSAASAPGAGVVGIEEGRTAPAEVRAA